jgi:hypothetical protein
MIIDRCPHCNASHVQTEARYVDNFDDHHPGKAWSILRCQNPHCRRLILAITSGTADIESLYPAASHEIDKDLPVSQEIRQDFKEAGLTLSVDCYKASMVMSRRVLQRCLAEQGSKQRKLVDAINDAIQRTILRKPLHQLATEIREYGNLGAHPDEDELEVATKEAATQILEFARLLINEFYEIPAAADRLRQQRQSGTGST